MSVGFSPTSLGISPTVICFVLGESDPTARRYYSDSQKNDDTHIGRALGATNDTFAFVVYLRPRYPHA